MTDKLDYFIERTDARLEQMDEKLDDMLAFKFKILGGSVVLSVLINLGFLYIKFKN